MDNNRRNRSRENDEVKYELKQHIGSIGTTGNGWVKEVNLLSWNDHQPGIDIRTWNSNHTKMSKGINITLEEATNLSSLLNAYIGDKDTATGTD